jgi:hypothetical protein
LEGKEQGKRKKIETRQRKNKKEKNREKLLESDKISATKVENNDKKCA